MPRYYFDWDDHADTAGADLADDHAARRYALRLAGEVIRDLAPDPHAPLRWRLDIRRGDGSAVAAVALDLQPAIGGRAAARPLAVA